MKLIFYTEADSFTIPLQALILTLKFSEPKCSCVDPMISELVLSIVVSR